MVSLHLFTVCRYYTLFFRKKKYDFENYSIFEISERFYFAGFFKNAILFLQFSFFCLQKPFSSVKIKYVEKKRQGGAIMAKCAICEKSAHFGNNVSHSHRRSNKMWKSNVKSVKVKTANGGAKKMYVCTSCLRSGKVERA